MDTLIRWVCVAEAHAPKPDGRGDLTVYQRSWAFCPAEARDAHEWREVGALTPGDLARYGLREPHAPASRS